MQTLFYCLAFIGVCFVSLVALLILRKKGRVSDHVGFYIAGGILYTLACFLDLLIIGWIYWIGILTWWLGLPLLWRLAIWTYESEKKQNEANKKDGEEKQ